jgi:hypothetical protein
MEVASPLTFGRVEAGSKRRFACSPIIDATMTVESGAGDDHIMDETYGHVVKRRRRHGSPEFLNTNVMTASPFTAFPSPQVEIVHAATLGKRQRDNEHPQEGGNTPSESNTSLLHKIIDKQNTEIQHLRNEKVSIESAMKSLNDSNEKVQHENKILKKAVALQQQRQNQALHELESARQYKEQAEDKIKMLEQVITSLRYHLQAQQPHVGNDFMGPRPPDVF